MKSATTIEQPRPIPDGCPFKIILATVEDTYRPDRAVVHTARHLPRPQLWMHTDLHGRQWSEIVGAATTALPALTLPSGRGNLDCPSCGKRIIANGQLALHVARMHLAKLGIDWCDYGECPYDWRPVRASAPAPAPPPQEAPAPVDPLALLASGGRARRTYRTRVHADVLAWLEEAVPAEEQPAFIDRALARMMALRHWDHENKHSESLPIASVFWEMTSPKRCQMVPARFSVMRAVLDAWQDRWPWLFNWSREGASTGFTVAIFWALYEREPDRLLDWFPRAAMFIDPAEASAANHAWFAGCLDDWQSTAITEDRRR